MARGQRDGYITRFEKKRDSGESPRGVVNHVVVKKPNAQEKREAKDDGQAAQTDQLTSLEPTGATIGFMAQQTHQSAPGVLNRRTLEADNRILAKLLQPGMAVLDVGCGTGAITRGIAQRIGRGGRVVGIDRDESLLKLAREANSDLPNLEFASGDALDLRREVEFDVVNAARTLQWIATPGIALRQFSRVAKKGGRIVVLDYDHTEARWEPAPPTEFVRFYASFLDWRAGNGWDNRMAAHLPELYAEAGIGNVEIHDTSETAERGNADFEAAAGIWLHVMAKLGPQMVSEGFGKGWQVATVHDAYAAFIGAGLRQQVLSLRTAVGTRSGVS